jgi:putative polyketide hydroxylase
VDLFGTRWVLLAGAEGQAWERAGATLARELDVYRIDGSELRDTTGTFHEAHGITPSGAVLVRPDGVVAWRERAAAPTAPSDVLSGVLARLLAKRPPGDTR